MSDFKVNSKTSTLEFKRKHNKLVEDIPTQIETAIQNDKDVLSQIVYDEENHTITFPKNVLPLRIKVAYNDYFFDYDIGSLILDDGSEGSDTFSFNENHQLVIDDSSGDIDGEITQIDYILNQGDFQVLNTYDLYHPITESGTKLYKHILTFVDSMTSETYYIGLISTRKEKYSTSQQLLNDTSFNIVKGFPMTSATDIVYAVLLLGFTLTGVQFTNSQYNKSFGMLTITDNVEDL